MFLKLIDEHGTVKLVNISHAQSIEKYTDPKEENDMFKTGIRIIWNDQILQESDNTADTPEDNLYFYSEQVFFGVSMAMIEKLLVSRNILVPPAQQLTDEQAQLIKDEQRKAKSNGPAVVKTLVPETLAKEDPPVMIEPKADPAPAPEATDKTQPKRKPPKRKPKTTKTTENKPT